MAVCSVLIPRDCHVVGIVVVVVLFPLIAPQQCCTCLIPGGVLPVVTTLYKESN